MNKILSIIRIVIILFAILSGILALSKLVPFYLGTSVMFILMATNLIIESKFAYEQNKKDISRFLIISALIIYVVNIYRLINKV